VKRNERKDALVGIESEEKKRIKKVQAAVAWERERWHQVPRLRVPSLKPSYEGLTGDWQCQQCIVLSLQQCQERGTK
jgi:hypothetical protein